MILFWRREEQAVQMQSDAAHFDLVLHVGSRLADLRQNALAVGADYGEVPRLKIIAGTQ